MARASEDSWLCLERFPGPVVLRGSKVTPAWAMASPPVLTANLPLDDVLLTCEKSTSHSKTLWGISALTTTVSRRLYAASGMTRRTRTDSYMRFYPAAQGAAD